MSSADLVFGALSDATRRTILALLLAHEQLTAGRIADEFPHLSRPAVSKHLRVLRDAGLVQAEEHGRENHYTLDARPLAEVQRRWLDQFVPHWEQSLERLKSQAEKPSRG